MTISSMGGLDDDSPSAPQPRIAKKDLALVVVQTVARLVLGFVFILWMMSLVPTTPEDSVLYPAFLAVAGIALYSFFFARQIKGVYKARYPTLRAVEALILTAAMFLAIFAMVYVEISLETPGSFTEDLNTFSAYYYALTVLATVGFGDIAPSTVPARAVTMVQMSLDIAFIAVLIRIMGGAAKKALLMRAQEGKPTS